MNADERRSKAWPRITRMKRIVHYESRTFTGVLLTNHPYFRLGRGVIQVEERSVQLSVVISGQLFLRSSAFICG
jgi:hypothetical protein